MNVDLRASIEAEVERLVQHDSFVAWKKGQVLKAGGLVVVNNSFVFRDVDTNKADLYLALPVTDTDDVGFQPLVASDLRFNLDFKYWPPSSSLPRTQPLNDAIACELTTLGELLFILIGQIDDSRIVRESVNHSDFEEIAWIPALGSQVRVEAGKIEVGQIHDEDAIWGIVQKHYEDSGLPVPDGLREAVGVALDKLQRAAIADLKIPVAGASSADGVTDQIVAVLQEQMTQYDAALTRLAVSPTEVTSQNEILRLAYNFASDATGYLKLIVSVCDLKPLVLWGTVSHHFALSESFRNLPWTRSRNKVSMKNYVETVSDARNSAFHNLFPFRKSLNVLLPSSALAEAGLIIFSEHGRKKENTLSYRDKPLVDVLIGFTRAREHRVTDRFWRQNREVMATTIDLFAGNKSFREGDTLYKVTQ